MLKASSVQISKKLANSESTDKHHGEDDGGIRELGVCPHHHHFHLCSDGNATVCQKLLRFDKIKYPSNIKFHTNFAKINLIIYQTLILKIKLTYFPGRSFPAGTSPTFGTPS